jgi:hypothetical protein
MNIIECLECLGCTFINGRLIAIPEGYPKYESYKMKLGEYYLIVRDFYIKSLVV